MTVRREVGAAADAALRRLPAWATLVVGVFLVVFLGVIDYVTGSQISFSVFYLAPVLFVAWYASWGAGVLLALVSAATWGFLDVAAGSRYSVWAIPVWNSMTRLGFFLVAAGLLHSLQRANHKVDSLAHTDALTGLANSRSFYRDLEHEIQRQRRYGSVFTLAYLDLDHFKEINDAGGHSAGDQALRSVGACIAAAVREPDVVARLGGDEFGVLLPETDVDAASSILTRLQAMVSETMRSAAPGVDNAGATVGAVVFAAPPESADAAILAADEAMFRGKREARGGLQLES